MVGICKKLVLFSVGGGSYMVIELLWRGRTHGSMFLAGGVCFLLLGRLRKAKLPLPFRGLAGAVVITGVELLVGLLFNRNYQVWDYRHQPLNFLGQVCFLFSLLWIPLSLGAMELYRHLENLLDKGKQSLV